MFNITSDSFKEEFSNFCLNLEKTKLENHEIAWVKYRLQRIGYHILPDGYAFPPHTVNLGVNNRCFFKCKMCDFGQNQKQTFYYKYNVGKEKNIKNRLDMPLDKAKKIIDECIWFRPIIRIHYLEPMLYSQIFPLIEYVKGKNLKLWLLTNGYTLPNTADKLFNLQVDLIRFSLNGPKKIHENVNQTPGSFDNLINGVKKIISLKKKNKSEKPVLGFYFTLTNHNFHAIYNTIKMLDEEKILPYVFINFQWLLYTSKKTAEKHNKLFYNICGSKIEESSLSAVDLKKINLKKVNKQYLKIKKEYISKGNFKIHFRPSFDLKDLKRYRDSEKFSVSSPCCYIPWYCLNISPQGQVKSFAHCFLPSIGNAFKKNIYSIWNGKKMRDQRKKLKQHKVFPGCNRCWGIYSLMEDRKRLKEFKLQSNK